MHPSTTVRETAVVLVSSPVDGTGRRPRAGRSTGTQIVVTTVPNPALQAALALAQGDLRRIRPTTAPEAVGGVALLVFNTPAQARRWRPEA